MPTSRRPDKLPAPPSRPAGPAFGAPVARPAARPAGPRPALAPMSLVDPAVFQPDPSHEAKQRKKTPAAQARAQDKSRQSAVQSVHAVRLLAPAIARAMSNGATEQQQVELFMERMGHARGHARGWLEALDLPMADQPWAQAALERTLVEYPGLLELPSLEAFLSAAGDQLPPPQPASLPLEAALPVALLQALGPVAQAQAEESLSRVDAASDLGAASALLVEAARDAVVELLEPSAPQPHRTVVFCTALVQAGHTLASLWRSHAIALGRRDHQRTQAERELHVAAHPEGEDLEPVFQAFREHAARLRRLARAARPKS